MASGRRGLAVLLLALAADALVTLRQGDGPADVTDPGRPVPLGPGIWKAMYPLETTPKPAAADSTTPAAEVKAEVRRKGAAKPSDDSFALGPNIGGIGNEDEKQAIIIKLGRAKIMRGQKALKAVDAVNAEVLGELRNLSRGLGWEAMSYFGEFKNNTFSPPKMGPSGALP
mmetsp:Transcript_25831/g.73461  ORF Transcript_25831/g.73461 Transcript_25831/m.73461 type:complete len:171 (+) Transcript_25831:63-575(+)